MRIRVQHDDGKGENVRGVARRVRARIASAKSRGKGFHETINLLCFTWELKSTQKRAQGVIDGNGCKVKGVRVGAHDGERVGVVRAKEFANRALRQARVGFS